MAITESKSTLLVADTGTEATASVSTPSSVENDIIRAHIAWLQSTGPITNTFSAQGWEIEYFDDGETNFPEAIIWKRMGSTPDTSIDILRGTGAGYTNSIEIEFNVLTGVDTTTALDATTVGPTPNAGDVDSASIAPVTNDALVETIGLTLAGAWTVGTAPSAYSNISSVETNLGGFGELAIMSASKIVATAGTEDPGAWNNTITTNFGTLAFTMAWRPATGAPPANDALTPASASTTSSTSSIGITETVAATPVLLGKWSGGTVSISPSTSWAAPASLFPSEDRNDDSAFSFAAATSTLTLPSSDLADGYLVVGAFEYADTSNGRHNPQARFIQASGTGSFVSGSSTGYDRDNSENRAYARTWAFVDNPSAAATLQFQWKRDTDSPTGGTVRSVIEVIPLYYSNHGIYSSTSTACPGGTTPTQITGFTAVDESDTSAIEIASNVVTLKGDNKRYLALGSSYWQGIGNARTQRWHGFRVDGTMDDTAKGYSYARNAANADIGEMFTTIIDRATTDKTIDQFIYRGPAVGTFPNAGADVDGNTTGSNPNHVTVILELNDSAEVFRSRSTTQQDINVAGTRVDLQIADTVDFNDSASFAKTSATEIDAVQATDVLLGANVSGGYASSSTARYTGYSELTINGTGQGDTFAGDYGRGNQSTQDCWGWSANLMSFVATSASDELGVNAGKITGGEGGTVDTFSGWVGFWGLNIQTLKPVASGSDDALIPASTSTTASTTSIGIDQDHALAPSSASAGASVSTIAIDQNHELNVISASASSSVSSIGIGQDHSLGPSSVSTTSSTSTVDVDQSHAIDVSRASASGSTSSITIDQVHAIAPASVSSAPSVSAVSIDQNHVLTPASASAGGSTSTIGLGQDYELDVSSASAGSSVSSSAIAQDHALAVSSVSSGSQTSTIGIAAESTVDNLAPQSVSASSSVSTVGIDQNHLLSPSSVSAGASVSAIGLNQDHSLEPSSASATGSTSTVDLDQGHGLGIMGASASSQTSSIGIQQSHDIAVSSVSSGASTSATAIQQDHTFTPSVVSAAGQTSAIDIDQDHNLDVSTATASSQTSTIGISAAAGDTGLTPQSVSTGSRTTSSAITQDHAFEASGASAGASVTSVGLNQDHSIEPVGVSSSGQTSSIEIGQDHSITPMSVSAGSSTSTIGVTSEPVDIPLAPMSANAGSSVTSIALNQNHSIDALRVSAGGQVSGGEISQDHNLVVSSVKAAPRVSAAELIQDHGFAVASVSAASSTSTIGIEDGFTGIGIDFLRTATVLPGDTRSTYFHGGQWRTIEFGLRI